MTKSELIHRIAEKQSQIVERDVELAVKTMLDQMAECLAGGGRIEIRGFGSFTLRFRRARVGRNPRTGAAVSLPARYAPYFKPGMRLRERDAHSRSCSKPSTASKPTAFTWSASRSASTPRRRPASSCSTSSAPSRTSSAGSSPSEPATASLRPGNAVAHRVDRRSTRRRFRPLRNSSRPDCHPVKPPNSSE